VTTRLTREDALALQRGREDPVWWMKHVLGFNPWPMQERIAVSVRDNRRTSVASCHGAGKTTIAARIGMQFLYNHDSSLVLSTAPTARQVEGVLWKEIRKAHASARYPLGGKPLTKKLELGEDWYAIGFTTRDYDSDKFQGYHAEHILVIVEEASGIQPAIFTGIEGVLTSAGARLLLIGNPTNPSGEFAASFRRKDTAKFHISAFDTPNFTMLGITRDDIASGAWEEKQARWIERHGALPFPALVTPEWVADKYTRWGPENPEYTARIEGQFPAEGDDALFPIALVEAAMARDLEPGSDAPSLGVDVARTGSDESTGYARQGPVFRLAFAVRKEDTMAVAGRAARVADEVQAGAICVDIVGLGAGVGDRLNELGYNVIEVNFGVPPVNDTDIPDDPDHPDYANHPLKRFANLKAQLYWRFRERLESGDADLDPDDLDFAAQATSIRWKLDSKGRIAIESKEQLKKRGMPSPDRLEAAIYSAADTVLDAGGFALV
jgi:phage terminase large subunit